MRSWPSTLWFVGIGVVVGVLVYRRVLRWQNRWSMARMRRRGQAGEIRAERWLRSNGFHIESDQATRACQLLIDGEPVTFDVRADFLVRDPNGARAVVEVKTGDAADPTATATRRQIFEYASVYGVKDVYLFDGSRERLMHLEFPSRPEVPVVVGGNRTSLIWLLIGAALGALAVFIA